MKRLLIAGMVVVMGVSMGWAQEVTQPQFHEVQPGETLSTIALRYGVSPELLMDWNDLRAGGMLEAGGLLLVGYQTVPAARREEDTATRSLGEATSAPPPTVVQQPKYHTVKKGENLLRIGKEYQVTVEQLQQWNNIADVNLIYPGNQLIVGYSQLPEPTGTTATRSLDSFTGEEDKAETAYLRLPGSTATRSVDAVGTRSLDMLDQGQPSTMQASRSVAEMPMSPEEELFAAMDQYDNAAERLPRTFALVVGISHYKNEEVLETPHDDAARFYAFLKSPEGGALSEDRVRLLTDQNATKLNILQAMREVFIQASPDDAVLLFFCGKGREGAFFPYDYDGYDLVLTHQELQEGFNFARAGTRLMFSDVSFSGGIGMMKFSQFTPQQAGAYYQLLSNNLQNVASINGVAGKAVFASENNLRQGAFTQALLEGLGGAADANRDRKVTLAELFFYVEAEVVHASNGAVDPQMGGPSLPEWVMSRLR